MVHDTRFVIGIDVSDKRSHLAILDRESGELVRRTIPTTRNGLGRVSQKYPKARITFEVGTHSPWMARLFGAAGHEVYVANPARLASIYKNKKKTDRADAEELCRLADYNPKMLSPIQHRGEETQRMLAVIRSRRVLVEARAKLINHVRGIVKSTGSRLVKGDARGFARRTKESVPQELREALSGVYATLENLDSAIKDADDKIDAMCSALEETDRLRQVVGIGPVTAATYVLTIEDPGRFARVHQVGSYLGLVPQLDQSGTRDPQLRINRCGDSYLRQLLVQAAHYVLGPFGPDTSLARSVPIPTCDGGV